MPNRDLKVTLVGEDKTSGAFGSAAKHADGLGSKIGSVGKGMALAFGGAVVGGVVGLGAALVQGGKDAASYQKVTDQVAQTIKATGGAAGVTVGGLKDYAGQIESMSGVDEELVLQGQNVLLTFTGIRNEAGKGNDIFNQTSLAASNLAATMGTDLVSANTLVGKALNDPIKGLTALQRVGVSFDAQQKQQIATMVKSGNTMGAQKVILGELNKEFGGAAKAAGQGLSGSLARAQDAFSDFFRNIATAVLPKLADFVEFITKNAAPALQGLIDLVTGNDFTGAFVGLGIPVDVVQKIESVRDFIADLIPKVIELGKQVLPMLVGAFQTVASVIGNVIGFFRQHENATRALVAVVTLVAATMTAAWVAQGVVATINAAKSVAAWFATATAATTSSTIQSRSTAQIVVGWLAAGAAAVAQGVRIAAVWVAQIAASAVSGAASFMLQVGRVVAGWVIMGVQSMIQAARMAAAWFIALGPIGWVIAAVVGIVALIITHWKTVVSWTTTAWHAVSAAVVAVIHFLVNLFLNFTGPGLIIKHWSTIVNATRAAWNAVVGAIRAAWAAVTGAISSAVGAVRGAISGAWNWLTSTTRGAWSGFTNAIGSGLNTAVGFIRSLPGRILSALGNLGGLLLGVGADLIRGLINGIKNMAGAVASAAKSVASSAVNGVKSFLGINSPSKVFHALGTNVGEGFINGIAGMQPAVAAQMATLANTQSLAGLGVNVAAGVSSTSTISPSMGRASSVPMVHIENYNEAKQPPREIAENLAFMARTR